MPFQLVVKHPFAGYAIGDHITDPEAVEQIRATRPEYVVRKYVEDSASAPSTPTPQPSPSPGTSPEKAALVLPQIS